MDARGRMRAAAVSLAVAIGCGPQVAIDDAENTSDPGRGSDDAAAATETDSGAIPSTTGMGPTTMAPDTSGDDRSDATFGPADSGDGDGGGLLLTPDACAPPRDGKSFHCGPFVCDPFAQDCPTGEKCLPWADDGSLEWTSYRCSPVAADPGQVGDACLVEGSAVSGLDDCDLGLMCFWVDPETGEGTCVPWCEGTAEAPTCADGSTCAVSAADVLALCLGGCDPIVNDCADGYCGWVGEAFACVGEEPGLEPVGAGCEFANECAPGSVCVAAGNAGDCASVGCCTSFCDLSVADPDAVCAAGQACTPWWERGETPEPWTHVGVCAVPS
jgi:hypothetical protein